MSALLLTASGDLDVSLGYAQVVTNLATVCAQKLNNLFKFFLGEWFLDTRQGVPYFKYVFVRNPDLGIVREVLLAVITQVPEVASVISADLTFNSTKRTCTAVFQVQLNDGSVLTGGPGIPFLISGIGGT